VLCAVHKRENAVRDSALPRNSSPAQPDLLKWQYSIRGRQKRLEGNEEKMKISARNVLSGKVQEITKGAVNAEVKILLDDGELVVSVITNSSVESLGLAVGTPAFAIVKASEVIVGKGLDSVRLSARNVLPGRVTSEVEIRLPAGTTIAASITRQSVKALELKPGDVVSAIVKASNVMIGV
jgi:molybdate transport system regulatory protein